MKFNFTQNHVKLIKLTWLIRPTFQNINFGIDFKGRVDKIVCVLLIGS